MKTVKLMIYAIILGLGMQVNAFAHEMQHGFILSNNDTLGSHLVATGHHSRQTEVVGQLMIPNSTEMSFYRERKSKGASNQSYFLLQAQQLDLPRLAAGMVLVGPIIESKIGSYEPKNIIVKSASFRVQKVLLNIVNPFFAEEAHLRAAAIFPVIISKE